MTDNINKNNNLDVSIVNCLIRNYFYRKGTFKGIKEEATMPQQVKDIDNYYSIIGFNSEEDFNSQVSKRTKKSFKQTVGAMIVEPLTVLFADYLLGFKISTVPGSTITYDQFFRQTRLTKFNTRMDAFNFLKGSDLVTALENFYPEKADVLDASIEVEGIYLGKYYLKGDPELPNPNEVLASLIGLDFLPSSEFLDIIKTNFKEPTLNELLYFDSLVDFYRELTLFAKVYNTTVYNVLNKLDVGTFDHSKTLTDGILLISNEEDTVGLITVTSLTYIKVDEDDFNRLYNENLLTELYMDETVEVLSDTENEIETSKRLEPYVDSLGIPLWKHLQLVKAPYYPNNFVKDEQL